MAARRSDEQGSGRIGAGWRAATRRNEVATPSPLKRVVRADRHAQELVGVLESVPAGEATLALRGALPRRHEASDLQTYGATLRFGKFIPRRHEIELDVTHLGADYGEVQVRSAERLPRGLSVQRYDAAVRAALEAIEQQLCWQPVAQTAPLAPERSERASEVAVAA